MPRTERQIATFMAYYSTAPKEERAWALDHLAKQEKRSPAEIHAICEKYKDNVDLRRSAPTPEELKERIKQETRAGLSTAEIHKKYGISKSVIDRIKSTMRESGEDVPDGRFKNTPTVDSEDRQPEAYPGQIYDNPVVENDVKIFLPGERDTAPKTDAEESKFEKHIDELEKKLDDQKPEPPRTSEDFEVVQRRIPYKKPEIITPPKVGYGDELWKTLAEHLAVFAAGSFGSGTKITSVYWNSREASANAEVVTVDGKIYVIQLEEIGHE